MKKITTILAILLCKLVTAQTCKEVVGYYPDWKFYARGGLVKPVTIDYTKYSIINYAFFNPQADGSVVTGDSWATQNILQGPQIWSAPVTTFDSTKSLPYNCKLHNVKCLMSFGGWSWSSNFPTIAASPSIRTNFVHSCLNVVRQYKLNGVDIDWEYPTASDKHNYTLMMQEFRDSLNALGLINHSTYLLTGAYPASPANAINYEWNNLVSIVDMFNLMAYDFFGSWDTVSNHNAPLYANGHGDPTFNDNAAFTLLTQTYGIPANKINLGMPFYGRSFASCTGLFQSFSGVDATTFPDDQGIPEYYNVVRNLNLFTYNWDNQSQVPYLTGNNGLNTVVSFDDKKSIGIKASYLINKGARGAIIWEITGDYMETSVGSGVIAGTPLVDTLNQVMCANNIATGIVTNISPENAFFFPNPSQVEEYTYLYYKAEGDVLIEVYSIDGRLLQAFKKGIQQGEQAEPLHGSQAGSYLIRLINGSQVNTIKWIVN